MYDREQEDETMTEPEGEKTLMQELGLPNNDEIAKGFPKVLDTMEVNAPAIDDDENEVG